MPPIFIKQFKSQHKCVACKKLTSLSMCPAHLRRAKLRFRSWSKDRRALGRCIRCNRKSFEGELRCPHHKEENKNRSNAWAMEFGKKKYLHLRSLGLCVRSHTHGLATHGNMCEKCRGLARRSKRNHAL